MISKTEKSISSHVCTNLKTNKEKPSNKITHIALGLISIAVTAKLFQKLFTKRASQIQSNANQKQNISSPSAPNNTSSPLLKTPKNSTLQDFPSGQVNTKLDELLQESLFEFFPALDSQEETKAITPIDSLSKSISKLDPTAIVSPSTIHLDKQPSQFPFLLKDK